MFDVLIILCGVVLMFSGYQLKNQGEPEVFEETVTDETETTDKKKKKTKNKWPETKRNFFFGLVIVLLGLMDMLFK